MSVQLFTKNESGEVESQIFDPKRFRSALATGDWVLDPVELEEEEPTAPTQEEADTNGTGKLSNKEVRRAAEKAGIEGFENKRISALKKQLGYV